MGADWRPRFGKGHYSALLKEHRFQKLQSVLVAIVHETRELMEVVHGDDFVFVCLDNDLDFVLKVEL